MNCTGAFKIVDVRDEMPNYENYKDWQRNGQITGIAIHHSATADPLTGMPVGDAQTFFEYHVNTRGWTHGGYNYVLLSDGTLQYALDEGIAGYHAGFDDLDDELKLEHGQYWNNHYLAICLVGYFDVGRTRRNENGMYQPIPNNHTKPTQEQTETLLRFICYLMQKYDVPIENVRGHRELTGCNTRCPGLEFDVEELRKQIADRIARIEESFDCCKKRVKQNWSWD